MTQTEKQKIGQIGENTACKFLEKHGYKIIERNYWKKWGEIDIIAKKCNILHFIEVKTVSQITEYTPEENVHPWKRKRISRAIRTYLLENPAINDDNETEWQIDIIAVFLDFNKRMAKIRILENIIL
jgi:putative endonuclease